MVLNRRDAGRLTKAAARLSGNVHTAAFDALVSAVVPVHEAESAFALAADRGSSCKVLLDFGA